ncbi:hypothetical protein K2X89_14300 [Myxococcota bacterium]|nr:hypothetical protein [Myxococcota bacterium]
MAPQASVDIFERAATARGRILRVEADRADALPRILALTFDIGRIVLRPADGEIRAEIVPAREALPAGLVPLDEEDPWWRVLGQPITAVWPVEGESTPVATRPKLQALKLRFRESDQNPRIVALAAAGPALRVSLEGN